MADVLVLTVDGSGNVPPALAIAAELQRRGHRVRVMGHPRQRADVVGHGLVHVPYRRAFPWSGQQRRSSLRAAVDFLRLVGDRGVGRDVAEALAQRPSDVVLVDGMIPGAALAARRLGVPTAVLMHTFAAFFLAWPMELAGRVRGFSPRRQWAEALTLVVTDRDLDPAGRSGPASYVWTGVAEEHPTALAHPITLTPSGGPPDDDAPLVLVSLSSVHIPAQLGMLQRILDGLADLPVRVLATTGPTIEPASLRAPANAVVRRHVPHHEVMPGASLVVGHGGHSTTVRALLHGLPLLVLPADPRIDQGMVGRAVADAGAGRCIPRSATPAQIRAAATAILTEPEYAAAAGRVGERMRAQDGVGIAVDRLLALSDA